MSYHKYTQISHMTRIDLHLVTKIIFRSGNDELDTQISDLTYV